MNEELRAITKNQRSFDSAVMMSSLMPSEKYSCSGSPLILVNGSTAMAGRSRSGNGELFSLDSAAVSGSARRTSPAKALARDGADQTLVLAAVADRLARGVDPAGQGRL